jgi:hypothetical protein
MTRLSLTVLFIPLIVNLAAVLNCRSGEQWLHTGMACFSDGHAALLIVSCVLVCVVGAGLLAGTCMHR